MAKRKANHSARADNGNGNSRVALTIKPDANELYPNDNMPEGMIPEDTCLEVYRRFVTDPEAFLIKDNGHG